MTTPPLSNKARREIDAILAANDKPGVHCRGANDDGYAFPPPVTVIGCVVVIALFMALLCILVYFVR